MTTGITDVEWLDAKVCELSDEVARLFNILQEILKLVDSTVHNVGRYRPDVEALREIKAILDKELK